MDVDTNKDIDESLEWYKEVYGDSFGPGGAYVAMRSGYLFIEAYYQSANKVPCDKIKTLLDRAFKNPAQGLRELYVEQSEMVKEDGFDLEDDIEFMRLDFAQKMDKCSSRAFLPMRAMLQIIADLDEKLTDSEEKTDLRQVRTVEDMPLSKQVVKTVEAMCKKLDWEISLSRKLLEENSRSTTKEGSWATRDSCHHTTSLKSVLEARNEKKLAPEAKSSVACKIDDLKSAEESPSQER